MSSVSEGVEIYNEDYFEKGIETGVSCYTNYRWMPEATISMAMAMIDYMGIRRGDSVLDYGCAKGFLVKAFRVLGRAAFGYDVSRYCMERMDPEVTRYCSSDYNLVNNAVFDFAVSKDVFEHMTGDQVSKVLKDLEIRNTLFVIVPLGDGKKYNVPAYELDKTHKIRQTFNWWHDLFGREGWSVIKGATRVSGIKENWADSRDANGFFLLRRS